MSEQFSYDTMLTTIGEALDDSCQTLEDIQTQTTNNDLWIIGTYQAAEALGKFDNDDMLYTSTNLTGVFGAIEYVQCYETDTMDQVDTDLFNPEKVASMIAYINMSWVLNDLAAEFGIEWDDELTDLQVENIKTYINDQLK